MLPWALVPPRFDALSLARSEERAGCPPAGGSEESPFGGRPPAGGSEETSLGGESSLPGSSRGGLGPRWPALRRAPARPGCIGLGGPPKRASSLLCVRQPRSPKGAFADAGNCAASAGSSSEEGGRGLAAHGSGSEEPGRGLPADGGLSPRLRKAPSIALLRGHRAPKSRGRCASIPIAGRGPVRPKAVAAGAGAEALGALGGPFPAGLLFSGRSRRGAASRAIGSARSAEAEEGSLAPSSPASLLARRLEEALLARRPKEPGGAEALRSGALLRTEVRGGAPFPPRRVGEPGRPRKVAPGSCSHDSPRRAVSPR